MLVSCRLGLSKLFKFSEVMQVPLKASPSTLFYFLGFYVVMLAVSCIIKRDAISYFCFFAIIRISY